jgi:hypothetical protein
MALDEGAADGCSAASPARHGRPGKLRRRTPPPARAARDAASDRARRRRAPAARGRCGSAIRRRAPRRRIITAVGGAGARPRCGARQAGSRRRHARSGRRQTGMLAAMASRKRALLRAGLAIELVRLRPRRKQSPPRAARRRANSAALVASDGASFACCLARAACRSGCRP